MYIPKKFIPHPLSPVPRISLKEAMEIEIIDPPRCVLRYLSSIPGVGGGKQKSNQGPGVAL